jgi:hypothetical protein
MLPQNTSLGPLASTSRRVRPVSIPAPAMPNVPTTIPAPIEVASSSSNEVSADASGDDHPPNMNRADARVVRQR